MQISRNGMTLALVVCLAVIMTFYFTRDSVANPSSDSAGQETKKLQLDVIAQVGPWPVASRLIGYRGKLWFANSVKGRNHNSADIWSFDPDTRETRYERHLYSQDAGHPLVYRGLLYWPFEDALQSAGEGVVEVTDGVTWQPLTIPNSPIYHTSQLLEWKDGLLAITGTRNAGMQLSRDAGRSWEEFYIHPTPSTHVSRVKEMLVFDGETYASLKDTKVKRLVRWTGSGFQTVSSWPLNRYFNGLTVHREGLFGIVGRGREREIWRFDGRRSIRVGFKGPFVDLASDGDQLWIVSNDGRLWSSQNGNSWTRHGDLESGRPVSIQAIAGGIYIAGAGNDGRGIVWGSRDNIIPLHDQPPELISQLPTKKIALDWEAVGQKIDALLSDPSTYSGTGTGEVRKLIVHASVSGAPFGFFAERLKAEIPPVEISAFGGNMQLKATDIARATLLSGMERAGHANVPTAYLTDPWSSKPNSYEKYFEIELSALRAVAASGQDDRETIEALLARLDFANDPPWLRSQVIGTLTAVSGKHFGYDVAAWRKWAKSKN
ncbi:MAG: sialidase family protein [Parasphingorhabdus sp.]|uniref:sialidase family protein n=1 Tax=Parasphingorhabdus sp. TaxID=2709688 RepID=UPI0032980062